MTLYLVNDLDKHFVIKLYFYTLTFQESLMKTYTSLLLFLFVVFQIACAQQGKYRLIVGTYTNTGKSQGIYLYDVDIKTATSTKAFLMAGIVNPSYLALTADKKFVYAVSEDGSNSLANAFSFDEKNSSLNFLNSISTLGSDPCYISVTKKHVFTANYSSGSISVFGRGTDGTLTELVQQIQHTGKGPNSERQKEPHVHQTILSPDGNYLISNDLGTDQVTVYSYSPKAVLGVLTPWDTLKVKPGSGPRHLIFSKNGKKIYLLHELDGTLSVVAVKNGKLSLIQETTIRSKGEIKASAADIHLSPDGKFLYATNRAPANTITCFSVAKNGQLTLVQQIQSGGDGPRNFSMTPDGKYLFIGNQNSDNVAIFKRDIQKGLLSDTHQRIGVPVPVCLIFY